MLEGGSDMHIVPVEEVPDSLADAALSVENEING